MGENYTTLQNNILQPKKGKGVGAIKNEAETGIYLMVNPFPCH